MRRQVMPLLRVLAQYEIPQPPGPPLVELLYVYAVPLWGSVLGYVLALAFAGKARREWLARGGVMAGIVFLLGVGLLGNFAFNVVGGALADATDGSRGSLESFTAIGVTAALMPYCTGRIFRWQDGGDVDGEGDEARPAT